ncbi:hypothetical protein GCM10017673_39110 [Streptosporangium violaceochromogenes]|nr:hypothetical protein GCM10017673_39110 [Streptosporangium violaceochromogenes]
MNPTRDLAALLPHLSQDERTSALLAGLWPSGHHPVLKQIWDQRKAAYLAGPGPLPGDATEQQTITLDDARSLAEDFERRRQRAIGHGVPADDVEQLPVILPENLIPGGAVGTIYGVRVTIDNPAPVVAETVGGRGLVGWHAILSRLLPKGTRPHVYRHQVLPPWDACNEQAIRAAKENLARMLGEPHVLALLGAEDMRPGEAPSEADDLPPGWRELFAATFRAIPGGTPYVVYRPAPALSPCWRLAAYAGEWVPRPPLDGAVRVLLLSRTTLEVRVGTATATGRVAVRDDGAAAEVYEVTAE